MTVMPREIAPARVSDIVARWAIEAPDRVALIDAGKPWTYAWLNGAILATADWLRDAGVRPGDRVMLVCENGCAAIALYFATTSIGAWPVIVNARLADREIDEISDHCEPRLVVLTTASSLRAKSHAQRLSATSVEPARYGAIAVTALNEATTPEPVADAPGTDVAALIYTTGTTGKPKGVMLTHDNLLFVAKATAKGRRLTPDDRVLATLPMSHILGLTGVTLGTLLSGGSLLLTARFDPAFVFERLKQDGVSVMLGAPSFYALLAEYAGRKQLSPIPAPSLRLISSAGAPLDMATKSAAEAAFGLTLHNGYGITECGPSISLTSLAAPRSDCAVGRILPGIEVKLCDKNGQETPAGDAGELWVKSPGVMKGYYRSPEETAAAVRDGWFVTGDLVRLDDGNLFIVGRAKEMIIRFGFNVYPAEVEGVLNGHPAVARSAVLGRQVDGSEEIIAFVQPRVGASLTLEGLRDFAAQRLAPYKQPSRLRILECLPLSPAGKVLKAELLTLL